MLSMGHEMSPWENRTNEKLVYVIPPFFVVVLGASCLFFASFSGFDAPIITYRP